MKMAIELTGKKKHKWTVADEYRSRLLLQVLEEKYQKLCGKKRSKSDRNRKFPKTRKQLTYPLSGGSGERLNSWLDRDPVLCEIAFCLFRMWDNDSQGKIHDKNEGMLPTTSVDADEINETEGRKLGIERHGDYGNRLHSWLVSWCDSFTNLWLNCLPGHEDRSKKFLPAEVIKITLLNTRARTRRGFPTLNMLEEIDILGCKMTNKQGNSFAPYRAEWVTPFGAPASELVWTWWVADIRRWMNEHNNPLPHVWKDEVATPCLLEHERLSKAGASQAAITKVLKICF